jgi:uncharacterized cupredoxin-like copper-binding protein
MSFRLTFPIVLTVVLATACTKHDRTDVSSDSLAARDMTSHPSQAINTVTVTARDFAFDAPATIPAGVTTIHLVNQGKEIHHVQVLKFEQGKTLSDFMAVLKGGGPPPAWAIEVGGPNAPAPSAEANATLTLDAGDYAFVCLVDTPDHVPHIMKGMARSFTVNPATGVIAAEPTPDATVILSDYSFTLSKPLTAGTHTIKIENTGAQPHEIEIVRLDSGKTVDDVLKWAATYKGAPPATPVGGMSGIAPGRHGFFTVDLPAGEYGLICFYPDMKDGKPHFMHGMKQQFKIS